MFIYYIYAVLRIVKKKEKNIKKNIMMRWNCGAFKFTLYASLASRLMRSFFRLDGRLTVFRSEDRDF